MSEPYDYCDYCIDCDGELSEDGYCQYCDCDCEVCGGERDESGYCPYCGCEGWT